MSNAKTYSRETAVIFLAGFLGVPGEFAAVREHLPLPSLEILPEDLLPAPPDGDTPPPDFCFRDVLLRKCGYKFLGEGCQRLLFLR